jgi:NTP pyrophosphatase (non-canonical NTP hydrolase)
MSWQQEYSEMVNELMHKDGEPSPLWVLALGLCGEASEVSTAFYATYDTDAAANAAIVLELGDLLWYTTAMMIRLGMSPARHVEAPTINLTACEAAGTIADMVKKNTWHGKPLDPTKVDTHLQAILNYIRDHAERCEKTLEDVARLNMKKLRARYPGGVFTEGGGVR